MLCLLLVVLGFFTGFGGSVPEISGIVSVVHEFDFDTIGRHLVTWQTDIDGLQLNRKLLNEVLKHKVSQLSGLLGAVASEFNITTEDLPSLSSIGQKTRVRENRLRREKRNFLGNILHDLTGVATEEQLETQLKLDREIRETVTQLLAHQVS